jgi:hypothetical protein
MPTANEVIANRPLSGSEIKRLMLEDFERNLANDAYLADHIAYGRLSWQITHTLHFDNPNLTGSESFIRSRPVGRNIIPSMPEMAAVEPFPLGKRVACAHCNLTLDDHKDLNNGKFQCPDAETTYSPVEYELTEDSGMVASRTTRLVTSPNMERVRAGMPVPTEIVLPDGSYTASEIRYPRQEGEGEVKTEDVSAEARAQFGLPPAKEATP